MRHCHPAHRTGGSVFAANALLRADKPERHRPHETCLESRNPVFGQASYGQTADRRGCYTPTAALRLPTQRPIAEAGEQFKEEPKAVVPFPAR
jgi:hypothetical protein